MENYKLIDVLKKLDKKEFRSFSEFVGSPYYNKNKNIIALNKALSKFYPEFNSKNLTIEKLFKKVFPKEKFDYHKINNIVSDLYGLTEKFLSLKYFENETITQKQFLLHELRKRRLDKIYIQKFESLKELLTQSPAKDEKLFNSMFEMYEDYSQFTSLTAPNTGLDILQKAFDTYFVGVLIRILRYYNIMLHEKRQNNFEYRLSMFEEVFSFLEKNEIEEPPILSIYKNIIYLETKKERRYYDELLSLKKTHKGEFTVRDEQLIFIHLFGFAAYNINTLGNYTYYKDAFNLLRQSLEEGVNNKDSMKYLDFLNIVKTACAAGELDWAEKFIDDFKSTIPKEEYESTINFSYGTIEQRRGNLSKALKYFSKTNFSNFIIKIQVKILLCKLHYELEMYDQVLLAIDSFRHYLLREKMITDEHKEAYYPFLKHLTQLIKIKEMPGGAEIDVELKMLKNEVKEMNSNPFGVRIWLFDQIGLGRD